ncbi:MAG: SDR family oxidoreductase [SAR202 cluster bacterium]|nr:SDR family oxidoreductase [SAR202 cluster bacterium]
MVGLLQDKVALITGGNKGLGRATALAMAREGAKVVVSARGEEAGHETVEAIRKKGGEAVFVRCDVTRPQEIEALVRATVETYGRLDCAFNNAGFEGSRFRIADLPVEVWDEVMDVNLKGVWLSMKYELPQMVKQGGGVIVNMSSNAGVVGSSFYAAYAASKWAVIGLTKAAALEYAKDGIRINAVCPAGTTTEMLNRIVAASPLSREAINARRPIGREGTPEEVAEPVVWLCSARSSYVNGSALLLDGAAVAR